MRNAIRFVTIALLVSGCASPTPATPIVGTPVVDGSSVPATQTPSLTPSERIATPVSPAPVASPAIASISLDVSQDPAFVGDRLTFRATSSPTGGPTNLLVSAATIAFGDGSRARTIGSCAAALTVAHVYRSPGDYEPTVTKVTPCDPSQTADLSQAGVQVHVFPAAPAASSSWPACSTFQLQLAGPWTGAGLGNVATLITLRNVGRTSCTLEGYPEVALVATGGGLLPTHDSAALTGDYMFPAVVPHRVAIEPGGVASFMIGYSDNPSGPALNEPQDIACPSAVGVRVILPGTGEYGTAHVPSGACGGVVRVSPIVPGAGGLHFP